VNQVNGWTVLHCVNMASGGYGGQQGEQDSEVGELRTDWINEVYCEGSSLYISGNPSSELYVRLYSDTLLIHLIHYLIH